VKSPISEGDWITINADNHDQYENRFMVLKNLGNILLCHPEHNSLTNIISTTDLYTLLIREDGSLFLNANDHEFLVGLRDNDLVIENREIIKKEELRENITVDKPVTKGDHVTSTDSPNIYRISAISTNEYVLSDIDNMDFKIIKRNELDEWSHVTDI